MPNIQETKVALANQRHIAGLPAGISANVDVRSRKLVPHIDDSSLSWDSTRGLHIKESSITLDRFSDSIYNVPSGIPRLDSEGHLVGPILVRFDLTDNVDSIVLESGEIAVCSDTYQVRVGNGVEEGGFAVINDDSNVYVLRSTDASSSAQNLLKAYNYAKTLTPNGSSLSETNRAILHIPFGEYDFGSSYWVVDSPYVDIKGYGNAIGLKQAFSGVCDSRVPYLYSVAAGNAEEVVATIKIDASGVELSNLYVANLKTEQDGTAYGQAIYVGHRDVRLNNVKVYCSDPYPYVINVRPEASAYMSNSVIGGKCCFNNVYFEQCYFSGIVIENRFCYYVDSTFVDSTIACPAIFINNYCINTVLNSFNWVYQMVNAEFYTDTGDGTNSMIVVSGDKTSGFPVGCAVRHGGITNFYCCSSCVYDNEQDKTYIYLNGSADVSFSGRTDIYSFNVPVISNNIFINVSSSPIIDGVGLCPAVIDNNRMTIAYPSSNIVNIVEGVNMVDRNYISLYRWRGS